MTEPVAPLVIVGRVRKAHGIRGDLVVEPITDAPGAIFAPGARVFTGGTSPEPLPAREAERWPHELRVTSSSRFKEGLIVSFAEVAGRTVAERWQGRYLLVPESELAPPKPDEVYRHDLIEMRVLRPDGTDVGEVAALFELPQGLALEVRAPDAPGAAADGTVLVPYRPEMVETVDDARRIVHLTALGGELFDAGVRGEG